MNTMAYTPTMMWRILPIPGHFTNAANAAHIVTAAINHAGAARTRVMEHKNKFQTPPPVCYYMVDLLAEIAPRAKRVLEPTPGIGNLADALRRRGYRVTAPRDYFAMPCPVPRYDAVVMNPPFSSNYADQRRAPEHLRDSGMKLGYYIFTECAEITDHVVAIMPWFTISNSDVRLRWMADYGLVSVTPLPRKTFGYIRCQTCVIVLKRGWREATLFKTFYF